MFIQFYSLVCVLQVILESLTQQTEKLAEARSQNDTLKHMVIQQSENSQDLSQCEKTQRLMELLKVWLNDYKQEGLMGTYGHDFTGFTCCLLCRENVKEWSSKTNFEIVLLMLWWKGMGKKKSANALK